MPSNEESKGADYLSIKDVGIRQEAFLNKD